MISLKEFNEYIQSFKKRPGEYTSQELFLIGAKHKELPKNDKSWKKLADKVGYIGNPNSYRGFVNRELQRQGDLPMKYKKEVCENPDMFESLYKEKTKIRDTYNAYRCSLRNEARVESFKDSVIEAINNLEPLNLSPINVKKVSGENEAILMLSDLHLGVNCHNFYNTYNYEVAKERIKKLAEDTINYCKLTNVCKLNIINLGDMIHGIIHTSARLEEEFSIIDQITKAAELISWMIGELTKLNINITYRSCTDNHSRALANKAENVEAENFNKLIDWYIKARLKNSGVEFSDDNIDDSLGKFDLLNGKKVMFAHGHLENVNKCIDAFHGATKEFIDYVLLSHFHSSREKAYNGSKLIINGSIVGTEQYALSKRLFGPAEQKLLIFNADNFIDININLQ